MSHFFLNMSYSNGLTKSIRYKNNSGFVNTTTGASSARTIPAGTVNNDIVLAFYIKENNSNVTTTAGWTQVSRITIANSTLGGHRDAFIFQKDTVINSDSGKTFTVTPSTLSPASLSIVTFSTTTGEHKTVSNLDVTKLNSVSNTITPAHVTATQKGDIAIFFACSFITRTNSATSFAPPTGATDVLGANTGLRLNIAYKHLENAETTAGDYKTNLTAAQNSQCCVTLLLSPVL